MSVGVKVIATTGVNFLVLGYITMSICPVDYSTAGVRPAMWVKLD